MSCCQNNCCQSCCCSSSISLARTVSPSTYSGANQTLTITYTITNTGYKTLKGSVQIFDDIFNACCPQVFTNVCIAPCCSFSIVRVYVTSSANVSAGSITSNSYARMCLRKKKRSVCSNRLTQVTNYVVNNNGGGGGGGGSPVVI